FSFYSFSFYLNLRYLHSFPTRRSSDLKILLTLLIFPFCFNSMSCLKYKYQMFTSKSSLLSDTTLPNKFLTSMNIINSVCMEYRRSEEHTSELQSRFDLVCRLLLEKKNI